MGRRNITIAVDEDLARWARVRAAQCDKSLSQMVSEMLQKDMEQEAEKDRDRRRRGLELFLAVEPRPLSNPGDRYPTRDEIYDRPGLR